MNWDNGNAGKRRTGGSCVGASPLVLTGQPCRARDNSWVCGMDGGIWNTDGGLAGVRCGCASEWGIVVDCGFVVVDVSSLGKNRRHGLNASRRAIIGGEAQMVAGGVGIASAAIWNR